MGEDKKKDLTFKLPWNISDCTSEGLFSTHFLLPRQGIMRSICLWEGGRSRDWPWVWQGHDLPNQSLSHSTQQGSRDGMVMEVQANSDFTRIQQDHRDTAGAKTYHLKEWEVALKKVSAVSSSKFSVSAKEIKKLQETTWKTAGSLKEKTDFRSSGYQKSLAVSICQQAANLKEPSGVSRGSSPNSKPLVSLWITLITC